MTILPVYVSVPRTVSVPVPSSESPPEPEMPPGKSVPSATALLRFTARMPLSTMPLLDGIDPVVDPAPSCRDAPTLIVVEPVYPLVLVRITPPSVVPFRLTTRLVGPADASFSALLTVSDPPLPAGGPPPTREGRR